MSPTHTPLHTVSKIINKSSINNDGHWSSYSEVSRQLLYMAAMMAKGKVYMCMTQGVPDSTAQNRDDWAEAVIKAKGLILQAIGQEYRHLVKSLETPQQMWEQLQGHFEEHVSLQVEMLQTQLNNIRQKDGKGINSYAARIAKICEQLDATRYKTDINR